MIIVRVVNKDGRNFEGRFKNISEAEAWVDQESKRTGWGKFEDCTVVYEDKTKEVEDAEKVKQDMRNLVQKPGKLSSDEMDRLLRFLAAEKLGA